MLDDHYASSTMGYTSHVGGHVPFYGSHGVERLEVMSNGVKEIG